jgi:hypothetical protein
MRRVRILIYESDNEQRLSKQLENSVHGTKVLGSGVTLTVIDVSAQHLSFWAMAKLWYHKAALMEMAWQRGGK